MITLTLIIDICIMGGWYFRYRDSKNGKYEFDPFEEAPTFASLCLVLFTLLAIILSSTLIVIYLP